MTNSQKYYIFRYSDETTQFRYIKEIQNNRVRICVSHVSGAKQFNFEEAICFAVNNPELEIIEANITYKQVKLDAKFNYIKE